MCPPPPDSEKKRASYSRQGRLEDSVKKGQAKKKLFSKGPFAALGWRTLARPLHSAAESIRIHTFKSDKFSLIQNIGNILKLMNKVCVL